MSHIHPYYVPPRQAPFVHEPQSQVVCQNCRTLLVYPQGAQNVRCARCRHITARPTEGGDTAQLVCDHCRAVLIFLRGAAQVQCGACHHINDAAQANRVGHLVCGCCNITLMYAHGAQSVKCAVCQHVTEVTSSNMFRHGHHGADSPTVPSEPLTQTVVIENPPSMDEHGNQVQNIVVGVVSAGGVRKQPNMKAVPP
eukprot:jgi/Botrbrau1/967/Bobra.114_1s0010.1